jgi:hypothetical protein
MRVLGHLGSHTISSSGLAHAAPEPVDKAGNRIPKYRLSNLALALLEDPRDQERTRILTCSLYLMLGEAKAPWGEQILEISC